MRQTASLRRFGEVNALRFARGDGDDLGPNETEGGGGQDTPVPEESPESTVDAHVLDERARVTPIAESEPVVSRGTAEIDDDTQYEESNNSQDLDLG